MFVEVWSAVLTLGATLVIGMIVGFTIRKKDELDCLIIELEASLKTSREPTTESALARHAEIIETLKSLCFQLAQYKLGHTDIIKKLLEQVAQPSATYTGANRVEIGNEAATGIRVLKLSGRVLNCLMRAPNGAVDTVEQLVSCSARDLLSIQHFGKACLVEVREKLGHLGLKLSGDSEVTATSGWFGVQVERDMEGWTPDCIQPDDILALAEMYIIGSRCATGEDAAKLKHINSCNHCLLAITSTHELMQEAGRIQATTSDQI